MTVTQGLLDRFNKVSTDPTDVVEHIPTFVRTVDELKATKVIELGVRYGVSTIAWLYALANRGEGQLWAVDVSFPIPATPDEPNLLDPQSTLGVQPHWIFMLGDCRSEMILNALPEQVDIIFIDTNHVYDETLIELELYYPRVRPGGRILLHDTAIEDTANRGDKPKVAYPVRTAMQEFCEAHNLKWSNVDNCCGLGTIYCGGQI